MYNDDFVFKCGPGEDRVRLWGVLYISDLQPRVIANFEQEFISHNNIKVNKLGLSCAKLSITWDRVVYLGLAAITL